MKLKQLIAGFAVMVAILLAVVQPACAARVYNFLSIPVEVRGMVRVGDWGMFKVAAGQRSDSINWTKETMLFVDYDTQKPAACSFHWFPHAELQGGNYLVISQDGHAVSCVLCNASHNVMYSSSGELPPYVQPLKSKRGC